MTRPENLANPNAELALLSACSRGGESIIAEAATLIREDWFSDARRAMCWRVMQDLLIRAVPVDLTLIEDGMIRQGFPEEAAREMVDALANTVPTAKVWKPLAERVESYFLRREGVRICEESIAWFSDLKHEPAEALESAEAGLFGLHSVRSGKGMRHISEAMGEALDSINESIQNRGHVTGGLACGFTGIDRCNIKGIRPGHVWVIGAPPGGGKTVMMMKLAWNIATGNGDYREFTPERHPPARVGIFSLEMDDVALAERVLISRARIEMNKMDRGQMSRAEQDQLARAVQEGRHTNIWVDYCPGITIQELRVRARYAVARYKLQCICIDYAQIIGSSSKAARDGNRTQAMMDVSQGIDQMAGELGVPLIVCAQPKQETWDQRAGLNALGETSQLAKDADMVIMLGPWDEKRLRLKKDEPKDGSKAKGHPAANDDDDDDFDDPIPVDHDDPDCFAYADIVKNRNGSNTVGKVPIKMKWERDFYNLLSTNDRLFDSTGKKHD